MLPKSCSLSACHQLKDLYLQPVSGVCLRKNKQTSVIETMIGTESDKVGRHCNELKKTSKHDKST